MPCRLDEGGFAGVVDEVNVRATGKESLEGVFGAGAGCGNEGGGAGGVASVDGGSCGGKAAHGA